VRYIRELGTLADAVERGLERRTEWARLVSRP
jgi:hypothetical protein